MVSSGIKFVREPKAESYGLVAVFEDLYGNLWIYYSSMQITRSPTGMAEDFLTHAQAKR